MACIHKYARLLRFPDAVRQCIGATVEFAERNGCAPQNVSGLLHGSAAYPYERIRDALAAELGVSRRWLDDRLDRQRTAYLRRNGG